jgi:hypothetical protein
MGVALAGGTVVPLIAFGLVQVLLSEPNETTQEPQRAAVSQVSQVAQARASGSWPEQLQEQFVLRAPMPAGRTSKTRLGPQAESRKGAASPKKSEAHTPKAKANPSVGPEPKVVLCHATQSTQQPGVTISVSEHGLAGLSKDKPGACG